MYAVLERVSWMLPIGWILLLIAATTLKAHADEKPPVGAKPLKQIAVTLEKLGYLVVEASIDRGRWEVDAYRDSVAYELQVDPVSGAVLTTHREDTDPAPAANALPLSRILESTEKVGYVPIVSADFEHGQWEIEAYHDAARRELLVDPSNGKIISDRADD